MKILLVKLKHIGDTLLLTPTIRFLRHNFAEARIDVVVRRGCESVLAGNADISRVFTTAPPEGSRTNWAAWWREQKDVFTGIMNQRYDYAFDLSNSDRAKWLVWLSRARVRGINDGCRDVGWKRCFFNRISQFDWSLEHQVLKDFRTVADVMGLAGEPGPMVINWQVDEAGIHAKLPFLKASSPWVVIHPTSRWIFKQWFPDRWAAVADHLTQRHGLRVIFSSGPDVREQEYVAGILHLARQPHHATRGALSLRELAWLIKHAKMFLGVDTVAMHIAAAVQTPTVPLFGKSKSYAWKPWQCRQALIQGECACRRDGKFICTKDRPYRCMEAIAVDAVVSGAEALL